MRLIALGLLLFIHTCTAWAGPWSGFSLWKNADQQGDALLQQGQPQAAAQRYHDPFRQAYAESLAGQYTLAAKHLGSVHNSDAQYNRGNALAHSGDLQGAIKAYDVALSLNPHNLDARHNREIVKRALKQPPQTQHQPDDNAKNNQQISSKSPHQTPAKSSDSGKPTTSSPATQPDTPPHQAQAHQSPEKKPSEPPTPARDNQAAPTSRQSSSEPLPTAPSDLQREQRQWLRSLPDAPGELLQREFMIEHQLRHSSQEQP
ncbi:MAG: tetratricopeptide repeat protein [Pseudomonadales bacterium]|nr:tetratricopeptide repeat protein [Pseudomonadales bacterium]